MADANPVSQNYKARYLTAHLAKEEDLIRRRNVNISAGDLHTAMYGSEDAAGKHTAGSVEDSIIARLLDSLRPSEQDLIEHLDRLILYLGGSTWTVTCNCWHTAFPCQPFSEPMVNHCELC